jgi:hypothetical protein
MTKFNADARARFHAAGAHEDSSRINGFSGCKRAEGSLSFALTLRLNGAFSLQRAGFGWAEYNVRNLSWDKRCRARPPIARRVF